MNEMNLGIIVISVDERKDIVSLFDFYFKKYWSDFGGTLFYLSDNTDFELSFPTLQTKGEQSLSKRLLIALESIKEEHALILCDDYLIKRRINNKKFKKCLDFINNSKCSFCEVSNTFPRNRLAHLFRNIGIDRTSLSLQPAIWNVTFLKRILLYFDGNPWEFEMNLWFNETIPMSNEKFILYQKNIFPFYNACFCGKKFFILPYNRIKKDIKKNNLPFTLNLYPKAKFKTSVHFLLVQFLCRTNLFGYRTRKAIELNNKLNKNKQ